MRWLFVAALVTTGCNSAPQDRPTPDRSPPPAATASVTASATAKPSATTSATASAKPVGPPEACPGDDVSVAVLRQQCTSATCTGDLARVELWRDGEGRLGVMKLLGDPTRCSHPPAVFTDWAGQALFTVPLRPVSKNEAASIQADIRQRTAPFEAAERVSCKALLAGRWRPAAKGRKDRTVAELKAEPRRRASYVVVGDVWTVRTCPPRTPKPDCEASDHRGVDLVDSATDRTPEGIFVQASKTGPLAATARGLKEGQRYRLLVEPAGNLGKRSRALNARFDLVALLGPVPRPAGAD